MRPPGALWQGRPRKFVPLGSACFSAVPRVLALEPLWVQLRCWRAAGLRGVASLRTGPGLAGTPGQCTSCTRLASSWKQRCSSSGSLRGHMVGMAGPSLLWFQRTGMVPTHTLYPSPSPVRSVPTAQWGQSWDPQISGPPEDSECFLHLRLPPSRFPVKEHPGQPPLPGKTLQHLLG